MNAYSAPNNNSHALATTKHESEVPVQPQQGGRPLFKVEKFPRELIGDDKGHKAAAVANVPTPNLLGRKLDDTHFEENKKTEGAINSSVSSEKRAKLDSRAGAKKPSVGGALDAEQ
ncbi:hypothetical protein EC957_009441 [Mortierella hygrophila]|uniref:Uncharacterized protein n=1 Tax=Mortierella hygrophila TaxID=979708 RepID=A0A9P6K5C6_9FUNG|nr:hypothetical protein EC957_009441 [Mortierella hygrophila]